VRRNHRPDENTGEVIKHAKTMGAFVKAIGKPCDFLIGWGGNWYLAEVKNPVKEGAKDEFTKAQIKFLGDIAPHGLAMWVWRHVDDVKRDLNQAKRPEGRR
jgi:hypothetical protein